MVDHVGRSGASITALGDAMAGFAVVLSAVCIGERVLMRDHGHRYYLYRALKYTKR